MGDLFSHPSDDAGARFDQSGWLGMGEGSRKVCVRDLEVPHMGVYRVKLRLSESGILFGQRRNLIAPQAQAGEHSFLTCLTEYIPSMQNKADTAAKLYASCCGAQIEDMRTEGVDARRIFIAGDSTVADQYTFCEYYPFDSYAGWGQMLSCFLKQDAICNMAHSGMTGRCFMEDGHFDIVKKYIQPNDLILIQFGHNDQKRRLLQANKAYTNYLSEIAWEAMDRGAKPVLLSPVSRVPSRDATGQFDLLQAHADAVAELAGKLGLPYIDLHSYTYQKYCALGEDCRALFKDMTHANDPGAFEIARFVARSLAELKLAQFQDAKPGLLAEDREKNPNRPTASPLPVPYVDIGDVSDRETVAEGVQNGLLDPCVLHMHPFEALCRAEFIQKLFRAAGLQGKPTDGIAPYDDIGAREFDSSNAAACRQMGLVDGPCFRPDDSITVREVNDLCQRLGFQTRLEEKESLPNRYELIKLLNAIKREREEK